MGTATEVDSSSSSSRTKRQMQWIALSRGRGNIKRLMAASGNGRQGVRGCAIREAEEARAL